MFLPPASKYEQWKLNSKVLLRIKSTNWKANYFDSKLIGTIQIPRTVPIGIDGDASV